MKTSFAAAVLFVSALSVFALMSGDRAVAASPATVVQGQRLFERDWPIVNPSLGGDGLGPLFNGQSCVSCHHQGGVGGGGDSRFNAKTVGIERLKISGPVNNEVIAKLVGTFHPGFVQADGSVINTLTLPHHGGSPALQRNNAEIMSQVPAEFSDSGGPASASEVRRSYSRPILFSQQTGQNELTIRARIFQRNTTSLFGAGLIDRVPEKEIEAQARAQKQHPEISGRPSTLNDGRLGRFGWRANVASLTEFVDQACANEVGLETRRRPQGRDPMNRHYRNPTIDIADEQIQAMSDFIAALPAPVRRIPESSDDRLFVARGERVFASVGCAVCHVANLGSVKGLYSDLLLHEMGYESIDLNHAEPYVLRRTPVQRVGFVRATTTAKHTGSMGAYYGGTTTIESSDGRSYSYDVAGTRTGKMFRQLSGPFSPRTAPVSEQPIQQGGFEFVAPDVPGRLINIVDIESEFISKTNFRFNDENAPTLDEELISKETYIRVHYERTRFNEEWRTPPLWGLRDSAPYWHDGRAETVLEAIAMHDGEAAGTRDRFLQLPLADRQAILAFLETLVAPPNVPQPAR